MEHAVSHNVTQIVNYFNQKPSSTNFVFEGFTQSELIAILADLGIKHNNPLALDSSYADRSKNEFSTHKLEIKYSTNDNYVVEMTAISASDNFFQSFFGSHTITLIKRSSGAIFCKENPQVDMSDFISSSSQFKMNNVLSGQKINQANQGEFDRNWYYPIRYSSAFGDIQENNPIFFNRYQIDKVKEFLKNNGITDEIINEDKGFIAKESDWYGTGLGQFLEEYEDVVIDAEPTTFKEIEENIISMQKSGMEKFTVPKDWLPLTYVVFNGLPINYHIEGIDPQSAQYTSYKGFGNIVVEPTGTVRLINHVQTDFTTF